MLSREKVFTHVTRGWYVAGVIALCGFISTPVSADTAVKSSAAATAVPAAGIEKMTAVEGITEYRLANGLRVLLFPDQSKPTITVNITYLVGSRHENYGETGMAHLLEHLMFKGAPKNPSIVQQFNRRGMRMSGTTGPDRTNYLERFHASDDNLKWAHEMEADRMVNSFIAKKDLDSEMTVVRNEYERGENSPFGVLLKRMQSMAYDWHNYGNSTIGNRSDIENVKIENLRAFYRRYYQPDNAVLLIAGKFDEARALAWIQNISAQSPTETRVAQAVDSGTHADGERTFMRRKGDIQLVALAYKVPSALHADSIPLGYAHSALTNTPSGRLHKPWSKPARPRRYSAFRCRGWMAGCICSARRSRRARPSRRCSARWLASLRLLPESADPGGDGAHSRGLSESLRADSEQSREFWREDVGLHRAWRLAPVFTAGIAWQA